MKEKVIFLCQRWTTGGIEAIITKILRVIDKDKYDFKILVSQKETNVFDEELKMYNVDIVQLNSKIEKNPLIRNIRSFYNLVRYLKKDKIDIIHINIYNSMSCIYGWIANKCKIPKVVLHAHNNGFDNDKLKIKLLLNSICKKIFYNKKYTYIACSNEAAEFCFNKKAIKDSIIINNGIDIESFYYNEKIRKEYREKFGLTNSFVVGNIGRFVEQKNQLRLIDIFVNIKRKKQNSKLILIGDGIMKKDIENAIKEKNIEEDVLILKNRKDVNKILQAMDCFVFPSLYEGYGIVSIEAQASGLPTFISSTLPKQIFASKNSYEIFLNDSDEEIAMFILDKTLKLKRESPNMEKYDIKNMVEKILKCYESR